MKYSLRNRLKAKGGLSFDSIGKGISKAAGKVGDLAKDAYDAVGGLDGIKSIGDGIQKSAANAFHVGDNVVRPDMANQLTPINYEFKKDDYSDLYKMQAEKKAKDAAAAAALKAPIPDIKVPEGLASDVANFNTMAEHYTNEYNTALKFFSDNPDLQPYYSATADVNQLPADKKALVLKYRASAISSVNKLNDLSMKMGSQMKAMRDEETSNAKTNDDNKNNEGAEGYDRFYAHFENGFAQLGGLTKEGGIDGYMKRFQDFRTQKLQAIIDLSKVKSLVGNHINADGSSKNISSSTTLREKNGIETITTAKVGNLAKGISSSAMTGDEYRNYWRANAEASLRSKSGFNDLSKLLYANDPEFRKAAAADGLYEAAVVSKRGVSLTNNQNISNYMNGKLYGADGVEGKIKAEFLKANPNATPAEIEAMLSNPSAVRNLISKGIENNTIDKTLAYAYGKTAISSTMEQTANGDYVLRNKDGKVVTGNDAYEYVDANGKAVPATIKQGKEDVPNPAIASIQKKSGVEYGVVNVKHNSLQEYKDHKANEMSLQYTLSELNPQIFKKTEFEHILTASPITNINIKNNMGGGNDDKNKQYTQDRWKTYGTLIHSNSYNMGGLEGEYEYTNLDGTKVKTSLFNSMEDLTGSKDWHENWETFKPTEMSASVDANKTRTPLGIAAGINSGEVSSLGQAAVSMGSPMFDDKGNIVPNSKRALLDFQDAKGNLIDGANANRVIGFWDSENNRPLSPTASEVADMKLKVSKDMFEIHLRTLPIADIGKYVQLDENGSPKRVNGQLVLTQDGQTLRGGEEVSKMAAAAYNASLLSDKKLKRIEYCVYTNKTKSVYIPVFPSNELNHAMVGQHIGTDGGGARDPKIIYLDNMYSKINQKNLEWIHAATTKMNNFTVAKGFVGPVEKERISSNYSSMMKAKEIARAAETTNGANYDYTMKNK